MSGITETYYIQSATSIQEKIDRLELIISGLMLQQIAEIDKSTVAEYWLNDGQIHIRTLYRNPAEISRAISLYENMRAKLARMLNCDGLIQLRSENTIRR